MNVKRFYIHAYRSVRGAVAKRINRENGPYVLFSEHKIVIAKKDAELDRLRQRVVELEAADRAAYHRVLARGEALQLRDRCSHLEDRLRAIKQAVENADPEQIK